MIFYFTGTGNSLYAAQEMAVPGERLVSIKEAVDTRAYNYELEEGERLGIVFPVYFGGLPTIVIHFIRQLLLTGPGPSYTYVILTNGGSPMGADRMVRGYMKTRGYTVDDVFSITMPDNYFLLYDVASEEEEAGILQEAEKKLKALKAAVVKEQPDISDSPAETERISPYRSGWKGKTITGLIYPFYKKGRKTKKFWVDDQCVGCCACQNRCPSHAIKLIEGRPVWVKDRCVQCFGCMRCGAIHYGQADAKHGRYKHPIFRKKH